jgi:hypothetical protein
MGYYDHQCVLGDVCVCVCVYVCACVYVCVCVDGAAAARKGCMLCQHKCKLCVCVCVHADGGAAEK